jgi:hypothetical protein
MVHPFNGPGEGLKRRSAAVAASRGPESTGRPAQHSCHWIAVADPVNEATTGQRGAFGLVRAIGGDSGSASRCNAAWVRISKGAVRSCQDSL